MNARKPLNKETRRKLNILLEVAVLVVAVLMGLGLRAGVVETMVVISRSMEPTLNLNERFLVDHRNSLSGKWRRGDVVIFDKPDSWPGGPGETFVKRIIGVPGDTLSIDGSQVIINGKPLVENYLIEEPEADSIGPLHMGADEYFMIGDNRNNSDDSRGHGPVKEKFIRGRVTMRLWPLNKMGRLPNPLSADAQAGTQVVARG